MLGKLKSYYLLRKTRVFQLLLAGVIATLDQSTLVDGLGFDTTFRPATKSGGGGESLPLLFQSKRQKGEHLNVIAKFDRIMLLKYGTRLKNHVIGTGLSF